MKSRRLWAILLGLTLLITTCPTGVAVTRAEMATDTPVAADTEVTPTVTRHSVMDYQYETTGGLKSNCRNEEYATVGTNTPPQMCLEKNPDGTYTRVEFKKSVLYIEYYDENFLLMPEKTLYKRLPLSKFGGAYFGKQYNYVLCGDNKGTEQANQYGVFALCQYDKDWNLLGVHKPDDDLNMVLKAMYIGSVSYAELGDRLYIHTAFQMIAGIWDSGAHQGCISFCFDQKTQEFRMDGFFDASHSMNQFVACDEENYYLIDHGDAPRSMQLWRCNPNDPSDFTYTQFMRFYGAGGDVETKAMLGGMEIIGDRVVTAVASIDHEYFFAGGTRTDDQYNIGVFSHSKDLSEYNEVWLTDHSRAYSGDTSFIEINTVTLVPAEDGYAYVMWEEITASTGFTCVRIAKIDSMGNQIGDIASIYARLSRDVPFYEDGYLTWYTTSFSNYADDNLASYYPTFYRVDVSRLAEYHHDDFVDISTLSAELDTYEVISLENFQQDPKVVNIPYGPRGAQLIEGIDYKISYENNLCPGTAQVVITGRGLFKGEKRVDYQVVHRDIASYLRLELRPNRVTFDPATFYNPDPEYYLYDKDGNRVTVSGTLTRDGGMWAAGTVLFTFTATDLRENGSLTAEYIIDPVPAEDVRIEFDGGPYPYIGQPVTPKVTVWYRDTLVNPVQTPFGSTKEYVNYTITCENNVNPGTAKAIIHFQGNYSGTREFTFTIKDYGTTPDNPGQGDSATLGDVDGDKQITSTDARLVLQFYAGKIKETSLNTTLADVDGDKQITSTDARLILQKYAGKIKDFPKK